MSLLVSIIVFLGLYMLISKVLIPAIEKREFQTKFQELTKIGWLAAAAYTRKFSLIALFTYGGLWIVIALISLLAKVFHNSLGLLNGLSATLMYLNQIVDVLNDTKTFWILLLLSAIALLLFVQYNRKNALRVYEKLKGDGEKNALEPLEPNVAMNKTNEELLLVQAEYQDVLAINPGELSPQEQKKRTDYLSILSSLIPLLQFRYKDLDIRRRIFPELTKTTAKKENEEEKHQSHFFTKFLTFFTSQGIVNTIGKTSSFISNIGVVFLLLSFLGASGAMLSERLDIGAAHIANIALEHKRNELKEIIKVNEAPEEQEWTEEDEEVAENMARHFELAVAGAFTAHLSANVLPRAVAYRLTSNAVRTNILRSYVQLDDGVKLRDGYTVVEEGQFFTGDDPDLIRSKKFSKTYANAGFSDKAETEVGKYFKEKFKSQAKKTSPEVWKATKAKWQQTVKSFSTTASPKDVLSVMFDESLRGLFNSDQSAALDEVIAKSTTRKVASSTLKNVVDYKIEQFTANVFSNASTEEVIQKVKNTTTTAEKYVKYMAEDFVLPDFNNSTNTMQNYQVTLNHEALSKHQEETSRKAISELESFMGTNANRNTSSLDEALLEFRNIFPGQEGMENASRISGNVADDVAMIAEDGISSPGGGGGGGGGGLSTDSRGSNSRGGSSRSAASMPTVRSRSFGMLRGFRRIGGVLIGHNPDNGTDPIANFTDINWIDKGSSLEIFLHTKSGKRLSAGTYSKATINQALAYAADGRSIAATMIKAAPVPFFKILVHPALVNTDLGCRIIGLDRLVDQYASSSEDIVIENALNAFRFQNSLYEYACMKLISSNESISPTDKLAIISQVIQFEKELELEWKLINQLLQGGAVFEKPEASHIAAKPMYFNQTVVQALSESMLNSKGDFRRFIRNMGVHELTIYDISDILKVQTEEWSGVRETEYQVDNSLSFLRPSAGQNFNLFPFEFIRQIVYNPIAYEDDDAAEQSDENPWEFPELKKYGTIEKLVWKGINSNPKDRALFEEAKSFTLAQRLFRTAINGQLGYEFPIDKLVLLAKITKPYLLKTETPTWNYNDFSDMMQRRRLGEKEVEAYDKLLKAQDVKSRKNLQPCN